jgi:hypothetical protein
MKNHIGSEAGDCPSQSFKIEDVADDGLHSEVTKGFSFPGCPGHSSYDVPGSDEQRHKPYAHDAAGARDKDPHAPTAYRASFLCAEPATRRREATNALNVHPVVA